MKNFLLLLLLITYCSAVQSDTKLIVQTCKNTPNAGLCFSSLKSDPRSPTADVRGLAIIMVDLIKAKATTAQNQIKKLMRTSPHLKQPWSSCASMYDAILTADIPEAKYALETGDFKFALEGTNDAANEADYCEREFRGKSPISNFNKVAHDTAAVAAAIVGQLL